MQQNSKEKLYAKGIEIGIYTSDFKNEFISLTDIARHESDDPNDAIKNSLMPSELTPRMCLKQIY